MSIILASVYKNVHGINKTVFENCKVSNFYGISLSFYLVWHFSERVVPRLLLHAVHSGQRQAGVHVPTVHHGRLLHHTPLLCVLDFGQDLDRIKVGTGRVYRKLERVGPEPICTLISPWPISAKIRFRRPKQTNSSLSRNCGIDSKGSYGIYQ